MAHHVRLENSDVLPLTRVTVGDLAPRVLAVGDPARAAQAAEWLGNARKVGENREYVTYTGHFDGHPVTVVSHGVGAAGAAVCFEELCRGGVTGIIRAGTAGGIQPDVTDGDLVVATGAVRDEGLTPHLVPLSYPAVADADLMVALRAEAQQAGARVHCGIVLTSDCFYPMNILQNSHRMWQRAGIVAVEMESAALMVIAAQHGVAAGALFAIDGNPLAEADETMSDYRPFREIVTRATARAVKVALRVLVS